MTKKPINDATIKLAGKNMDSSEVALGAVSLSKNSLTYEKILA